MLEISAAIVILQVTFCPWIRSMLVSLNYINNSGALCVHVAQVTRAGVRISSGLSHCVNRPL